MDISFLMGVWNHTCKKGDIVFLSTKDSKTGKFRDHPFSFNHGVRRKIKEWSKQYTSMRYDIYFCPTPFNQRRRLKTAVKNINILWSDIDESKPKIKPTHLWESSPGRLQALWFLSGNPLDPSVVEKINKDLSYYNDADKGGWDITQVLRVPGTKNHKYATRPEVRIIESDNARTYSPSRIKRRIGSVKKTSNVSESPTPQLVYEQILNKFKRRIPARVKRLLSQQNVIPGKRSDILWYMENKLSESGLNAKEIICLVKHSAWNKYKGRPDEDIRLRSELEKIIESNIERTEVDDEEIEATTFTGFTVESYSEILRSIDSDPGWMVDGIWMNSSHGIVAGEPKSFKSTLALDMAIAVASDTPFLGKFEVVRSGPVLYINNENARWIMKDRISKIAAHRDLIGRIDQRGRKLSITWAPDMPLFMVSQQSFLLTDPLHQKLLEKMIMEFEPKLIILDPLYLMFDGDVNSARELNPVLSWLLEIKHKYNMGVMLVHHYNKGNSSAGVSPKRGGQRMLGSTTLHGWIESAWYIEVQSKTKIEEGVTSLHFDREFRGAGLYPELDINIIMGDIGSTEYDIEIEIHKKKPKVTRGKKKRGKKK